MVSSKVIAIRPWVFVYLKSQYASYCKSPKDTVWDNQERQIHSLFADDLKVYQESHKTLKDVNEMYRQVMVQVHVTE